MSGKRKRKPKGMPLSPEMQAIIREALGIAGWDGADVAELLASGALDDPMLRAALEGELSEAFEVAAAHELLRAGHLRKGGG